MNGPTKIAVIGCGFYAATHLRSWRDLAAEGAKLVAVCDIDPAKAAQAGRDFGVPHFTDIARMLDAAGPNLVDIVTRVDTHRSIAEMVLRRGIGAIVQKPFALTMSDARAIVAAADQTGAWLAVHENFRYQPPVRRVIELIEAGAIGVPNWGRISFRTGFDVYATQPYFLTETRLVIADVGVHVLDLSRRLLGEVVSLSAETQHRNPRVMGEDTATMLVRHQSSAVSVVECTYESRREPDPFPETMIELEGKRGALTLLAGGGIHLTQDGCLRKLRNTYRPSPWMDKRWAMSQAGALEACRHFLARFRAGLTAETDGHDNLKTAALVEAAYLAADRHLAVAPSVAG